MWVRFVFLLLLCVCVSAQNLKTGFWNGRPVVYEEREGWAVAEGDILLGRVGEIPDEPSSSKSGRKDSIARSSQRVRWPGGVIPYVISDDLPNKKRIIDAIDHWNQNTPIRLVERTDEGNYVRFARPASTSTCNSFVGMVGREQVINIGDGCSAGSTIHEIGHSVGLFHEQSRQDRDLFLKTNLDNADKRTLSNFTQQLFDADDIGTYDHTSIMHYDIYGFSRNGLPVLETIPVGIPVSQRERLSPGDLVAVRRIYGWPVEETTISTNPLGLEITVDGETYISPRAFRWEAGSQHTIGVKGIYKQDYRYVFQSWNDGSAIEHSITASSDMPVYSANFVRLGLLTLGPNVTANPASEDGYYPEGAVIELQANPPEGFQFQEWTGVIFTNHGRSQNPLRINMRAPELRYQAILTRAPLTTITSDPIGLRVLVDGAATVTPRSFPWAADSTHQVRIDTPTQTGGNDTYRNIFRGWSDDGDTAHSVIAERESKTLTARFQTQYVIARGAAQGGLLDFSPASSDGYYDAGTQLQVTPNAVGLYRFQQWTGDLSGSDSPAATVVDDHKLIGATFLLPKNVSAVMNSATLVTTTEVAPDELITITGLELGSEDGNVTKVRVTLDELSATVLATTRDSIRVLVPKGIATRSSVTLRIPTAGSSAGRLLAVVPASPGIFSKDDSGKGQARAWNADGSENDLANRAEKGSSVIVLATGIGDSTKVGAEVSGRAALVEEVAPESPGIFRIRLKIPTEVPSGPVPVVLRSIDSTSVANVYLALR